MDIFSLIVSYWYFWLIVVVGTTIWMGFESAQHRIPIDSKSYSVNNGSAAWVLSGILLWIATFPYYLVKRGPYVNKPLAPASPVPPVPQRSLAEELAKLNELHQSGALTDGDFERAKDRLLR